MKLIASVISAVITLTASLAGIIVLMLVTHVTVDVVMRFAFDTPLNSTILYVSAFYMVAIAFLPLAAVEQNDGHIAVELLVEKFPTKVQSFLAGLALLLTCIVTATVAIRKVTTWPTYLALPLGFGLMSIVAAWKFICHLTGRPHGLNALKVEDPYLAGGDA